MAYWLLQCNPLRWRILDFLADGHELRSWSVGRYYDELQPGDRFALWMTGRPGGVAAIGRITGPAEGIERDAIGDRYWDPAPPKRPRREAGVELDEMFFDTPITRAELESVPEFREASILKSPRAANPFPLTEGEWAVITERLGRSPDDAPSPDWPLALGKEIRRVDLHDRFGGGGQSGISPSRKTPNIFLFSDPRSGARLGYEDRWAGDKTFFYAGEGQTGDQVVKGGNRAVVEHRATGRALRLFEGAGGVVRYVGEFELNPVEPWRYVEAGQRGSENLRRVIRFRLNRVAEPSAPAAPPDLSPGVTYRPEDEDVILASPILRPREDPDSQGRGLRAHRRLQNDLAEVVRAHGLEPCSPAPHDPDFDLAWTVANDHWVVVEIKSLTRANETRQLRTALGQVLDYANVLQVHGLEVSPFVHLPRPPTEARWADLLQEHGIGISWPGVERRLPGLGLD